MSLRSKLFGDGTCPGCSRYSGACICDRPTRVTTKGVKPVRPTNPRAKPRTNTRGPYPCAHPCRVVGRNTRAACGATVRGGICPCPACP